MTTYRIQRLRCLTSYIRPQSKALTKLEKKRASCMGCSTFEGNVSVWTDGNLFHGFNSTQDLFEERLGLLGWGQVHLSFQECDQLIIMLKRLSVSSSIRECLH
jgi:hypothetical protein